MQQLHGPAVRDAERTVATVDRSDAVGAARPSAAWHVAGVEWDGLDDTRVAELEQPAGVLPRL